MKLSTLRGTYCEIIGRLISLRCIHPEHPDVTACWDSLKNDWCEDKKLLNYGIQKYCDIGHFLRAIDLAISRVMRFDGGYVGDHSLNFVTPADMTNEQEKGLRTFMLGMV